MEAYYPYLWIAVIIGAAVLEATTAGLVSIWMVVGGIAAFIANLLGASLLTQVTIFVMVTALTLALTRPLVKKIVKGKKVDTNADRYIGKTGVVLVEIDNQKAQGQVNVLGNVWTARSDDGSIIPAGHTIQVLKIEGVKLIVEAQT